MSLKNPKVSIIIPVYNGSNYVNLAIDSALRQTYENKEIIVINDGSKDDTLKVINSYGDKIRVIDKENGGVSSALNLGIKEMTGEYFSWLSHDDIYYPEKIEEEIKYLNDNDLLGSNTIVYSDFDYCGAKGEYIYTSKYSSEDLNRDGGLPILKCAINGLSLLIPKKAFKECGDFDINLRACQDYKLWFEMYKKGYKFVHIPKVLVVTRIHSLSVSNTSPKVVSEGNEFWCNLINYFNDNYKKNYFNTVYNYYYDLLLTLFEGPYNEAKDICTNEMSRIEKNIDINKYKVSIIIPYEEVNKDLIKCINSVLNQDFKNIELLLVNNGCVNNKEIDNIINSNKKIIKLVTYKEKKKLGVLYKEVISKSTGDYISILKPNSIYKEGKISNQLLKMIASSDKISHTSYSDKEDKLFDTGYKSGILYPIGIKDYRVNISTFMFLGDYLRDNICSIDDDINNIDDNYLYLYLLKDNRVLGINDSYVITDSCISNDVKIKYLVNTICKNYNIELFGDNIDDLMDLYNYNRGNSIDAIHHIELDRYNYMLSKEYNFIYKYKDKSKVYLLDNNKIKNNKMVLLFKLIRKIRGGR